jgi:hypothetical protein
MLASELKVGMRIISDSKEYNYGQEPTPLTVKSIVPPVGESNPDLYTQILVQENRNIYYIDWVTAFLESQGEERPSAEVTPVPQPLSPRLEIASRILAAHVSNLSVRLTSCPSEDKIHFFTDMASRALELTDILISQSLKCEQSN